MGNREIGKLERVFLWTGGALFVGALAWLAYALIITWGVARPFVQDAAPQAIVINTALFTLFAAHHSVFARTPVKSAMARLVPERLVRSVYVWIASLLLILAIAAWQPIGGLLWSSPTWLMVVLVLVQIAGVLLIGRAVRAISALELAGIRPPSSNEGLETRGPYRLVRHPIYLGTLLVLFAPPTMTGDRLLFAVLATVYLVIAVRWEERSLAEALGEPYRRYQQQVRWRMVPFLY